MSSFIITFILPQSASEKIGMCASLASPAIKVRAGASVAWRWWPSPALRGEAGRARRHWWGGERGRPGRSWAGVHTRRGPARHHLGNATAGARRMYSMPVKKIHGRRSRVVADVRVIPSLASFLPFQRWFPSNARIFAQAWMEASSTRDRRKPPQHNLGHGGSRIRQSWKPTGAWPMDPWTILGAQPP